jgi:arginase
VPRYAGVRTFAHLPQASGPDGLSAAVLGAPFDTATSYRAGARFGPEAIRSASALLRPYDPSLNVLGLDAAADGGDLPVTPGNAARTMEQIAEALLPFAGAGVATVVLGGDHSVALGTLGGLAAAHGAGGVLWIDAHADVNTPETSPSGNVHGMPLAAALGLAGPEFDSDAWPLPALDPRRVVLLGLREADSGERKLLHDAGVRVFTMSEIDRIGVERAVREALDRVAGPSFVHVSLDMDALDPEVAPGVGTPVRGGLTYREAHLALELVAESGLAGSLEVVEVNPILDRENTTAFTAVELVASALGATII